MRTFFVLLTASLSLSLSTQAQDIPVYCDIQLHEIRDAVKIDDYLARKLEACVQNHILQTTSQYFVETFSNADGEFKYFKPSLTGGNLFSERRFKNNEGDFLYLRKGTANEATFFSMRSYGASAGHYVLFRRGKDPNAVIASIREFMQGSEKYAYFRLQDQDTKTLFSIKRFFDGNDEYVYFRRGKEDQATLFSSKNTLLRDANRTGITLKDFHQRFREQFWKPIVQQIVTPIAAQIDAGF